MKITVKNCLLLIKSVSQNEEYLRENKEERVEIILFVS